MGSDREHLCSNMRKVYYGERGGNEIMGEKVLLNE